MIAPAVFFAFFLLVVAEAAYLYTEARRVRAVRERAFWSNLRADALHDYGRLFDWEREGDL